MANRDASSSGASYPELLSLAVHELRTPASVVGGYLRMLQRDSESPLNVRQQKMVDEADKACARIVAIVGELSDLAKLDTGTVPLKDDSFDLFAALTEVATAMHEAEGGVHLLIRGEAAGAPLRADLGRVRAAFSAFVRAVVREQSSGRPVVLDRRLVRADDRTSALTIIAPDGRVQQAYDASPAAFDEKRGGLGLALPIARRVVERYGGRVWSPRLETEASAAGNRTAIIVSFPLAG